MLSHGEKRRVTAAGRRCGKWEASQQGLNLGGRRGTFNTRGEVGSPELLGWPMVFFMPLRLQLLLWFSCSVPPDGCHSFSHYLPLWGESTEEWKALPSESGRGLGRSHLASHSQLDFIGMNPIKCLLWVSGNSGKAAVSV